MKVDFFSSNEYLSARDIEGHRIPVTIASAQIEVLGDPPEEKITLTFQGKEKRLVLNVSNGRAIQAAFGDETENWKSREIVLTTHETRFKGNPIKGILVIVPPVENASQTDEIPF